MWESSYKTLFSPSDVTAFHRIKYGGGGCYITLFSPRDVTAFHRIHLFKCGEMSSMWVQTPNMLNGEKKC